MKTDFFGSQDAYWLALYEFGQNIVVKYTCNAHFEAYKHYARTSGWGYFYPGIAIVSGRPTSIMRLPDGRLHNDKGPAISFADGFGVWAFNGVRLPKQFIAERDIISPIEVLKLENVEQRAAAAACVGWDRMLDELPHRIIDSDPNPDHGDLIEIDFPDFPQPGRFLRALCPRNGTIMEGVPPEIETVFAAQAWKAGLPESEFVYPEIRT